MTIRATCMGCGRTIKGGDDWAGRSATCPGCGSTISFATLTTSAEVTSHLGIADTLVKAEPTIGPMIQASRVETTNAANSFFSRSSHVLRSNWAVVVAALVALPIGYFAGRSHLKYEIRSAFTDVGQQIKSSLDFSAGGFIDPNSLPPDPDLDKLIFTHVRFYKKLEGGFHHVGLIDVTIRNDSRKPLLGLMINGVVQTPGRAAPWAEDDLFHEIPGGLEPGETQTWTFKPKMISAYYATNPRDDAELGVKAVLAEWAGGP